MATTDHTLKLRAVLDTKQVQQELQRLKQSQTYLQSGQSGQSSVARNATSNLGNVTNLNGTLMQLNRSIQSLVAQITRLNGIAMSPGSTASRPNMVGPGVVGGGAIGDLFRNQRQLMIYETLKRQGLMNPQDWSRFQQAGLRNPNDRTKLYNALSDAIGWQPSYEEYKRIIESNQFRNLQRSNKGFDARAGKFMGGMLFHQVGGSVQTWAQAAGHDDAAQSIGSISKIAGYTLMGASVGGVYGAGIGAAAGAIEGLFDLFTQKAQEGKQRIDEMWDRETRLGRGTTDWKRGLSDYRNNQRFSSLIEQFGEDYKTLPLEAEYGRLATRKDFVQERLDVYQKMSEQGFLGDADLKAANDLKNELSDLDNKMKTITSTLKNYRKAFEKAIESDEYSEKSRRLLKSGSLADIEGEITTLRESRDKAKAAGNIEDFTKYSSRIRQLEQREELIKETQRSSTLELSRMDESYNNSRILERFGIGGGAGVRSTMMGYARQAASERRRYEQLMSEGRLEEAAKAKSSWQFAAGERNSLADTLLQVLGNRTADLTNVTSLASIGANMGERNDNFDRQMAVWEDQRNLQREIKNILNEKTFESTYGE